MLRRLWPGDAARPRLAAKLALFLAGLGLAVICGIVIGAREFLQLAVDGPAYRSIAQSKALAADFTAAGQLINVPFVATDALIAPAASGDSPGAARAVLTLQSARVEYLERREFWRHNPPADSALTQLMERAARPALAFFDAFDRALSPAIERHDYAAARRIREGGMDSLFRDQIGRV